ncbi:uncharacterized protein PAC_00445 [Phialocephala subalpina]|uniref:C2H2-type domain-containing protein n=1 Tax=Phialocephala subalpina TaxID=576137 RepID=A0A1L7WCS9_9HELO|nr:uncharacterized protein PAC_00445 [Phialocephala subalpina]
MAPYCPPCDRSFGSQQALQQHLNSPAHDLVYECDECDRAFDTERALNQHLDSPAHDPVYECKEHNRTFASQQALNQHLDSPAHDPVYECKEHNRTFDSQQALSQHLNSPAHAPVYECDECDREFGSQQALNQHLNSPAHAPVYECDECEREFGSQQALNQHLNSPAHIFECDECDRSFGRIVAITPVKIRCRQSREKESLLKHGNWLHINNKMAGGRRQESSKGFAEDWGKWAGTQYCRSQSKPTTSSAEASLAYGRQACALVVSAMLDIWQICGGKGEYEGWSSKGTRTPQRNEAPLGAR